MVRGGVIGKLNPIEVRLPIGNSNMRNRWRGRCLFDQQSPRTASRVELRHVARPSPQEPTFRLRHGNFRWNQAFSWCATDWGAHIANWPMGHDTETPPGEVEGWRFPSRSVQTRLPVSRTLPLCDGVTKTVSRWPSQVDPNPAPMSRRRRTSRQASVLKGLTAGTSRTSGAERSGQPREMLVWRSIRKSEIYRAQRDRPRTRAMGANTATFRLCESRPATSPPAETGHPRSPIAHIGNITMLLGRKLPGNLRSSDSSRSGTNRMLTASTRTMDAGPC